MDEKILEALKASGVSEEVISQLSTDDGTATRLTTLEAKLAAAEGKSAGILGDKKKSQEKTANVSKVRQYLKQGMSLKQAIRRAYPHWPEWKVRNFAKKMAQTNAEGGDYAGQLGNLF